MDNFKSVKLKNNFQIISNSQKENKIIYLGLFIKMGSNWEEKSENGFSHFLEHLVFKSTKNYPNNGIMEQISFLGGSVNAFTEYNTTCYYLTLPPKHIEKGIEVLSQIAQMANFSKEEFETEKGVVIEELYQYQNDPDEYFFEKTLADFFVKSNYRKPIIGQKSNLLRSTADDLGKFYRKYYSPSNSFLVATGAVSENLHFLTNKYFGAWRDTLVTKLEQEEDERTLREGIISFEKKIVKEQLNFVLHCPKERDEDYLPFSIALNILGEDQNSRLYKRLYQKEKLVDGVNTSSLSGVLSGGSLIHIFPRGESLEVIKIVQKEIEKFVNFGVRKSEFKMAQQGLSNSHKYAFEFAEELGGQIGFSHLSDDYKSFFSYLERLKKVSLGDVQRVIKKYFPYYAIYHLGAKKILQKDTKNIRIESIVKEKKYFECEITKGFKLILKQTNSKRTCGICMAKTSDQLSENMHNLGINNLASSMMAYGNEAKNYEQFLDYCYVNGIKFSINSSLDVTSFNLKCFSESVIDALYLLRDVFLTPTFPKDHFENLKQSYLSYFKRIEDYPTAFSRLIYREMLFGENSPIVDKRGTYESIKNMSLFDIKSWYKKKISSGKLVLTIVGNINFEEILSTCKELFGDILTNKESRKYVLNKDSKKKRKIITKIKNSTQDIVRIGGFTDNFENTRENTAFLVLSEVIGGNISSRMFNLLREKLGIVYACGFSHTVHSNLGYFSATALLKKNLAEKVVTELFKIFKDIKNNGITSKEMSMSKQRNKRLKQVDNETIKSLASKYFNDIYISIVE